MNHGERYIARALAVGDETTAAALFKTFADVWRETGDIRLAWLGAVQIARRVAVADTLTNFPAFGRIMRGDDEPAKSTVMRALVDSVEMTAAGLDRNASLGMEFPEGVATAILRMRQFQTEMAMPAKSGPKPASLAALPLPDDIEQGA